MAFVEFENVGKTYHMGEVEIDALHDVSFQVEKGELVVIVGPSGAGKTTLLNILGGMDTLSSGRVTLDGQEISALDKKQLTQYRRYDVGFVFQFYNLIGNLTALENVELANQICKNPLDAAQVLREVGLEERMKNFPSQLSGGEQQRVAIARAQLTQYRRYDVGFVFQFYNLIGNLTALENVELANQICKNPLDAAQVLREVGLEERMKNFPSQLSGGEQQRVAIARALAKNPKLLLCDEPTGALDYQTGKAILQLLQDTGRKNGMTVIIITHNAALTAMADRVIRVKNGTVSSVTKNEHPKDIAEIEW